jgi:spore germination protein GerM
MLPGTASWAAVVLLVTGCGVPDSGPVTTVPSPEVPFGLLRTDATSSSAVRDRGVSDGPGVYFIREERLVRVGIDRGPSSGGTALDRVLEVLSAGPNAGERRDGLGSAIPAGLRLRGRILAGGVAQIELAGETAHPEADQNVLAVGQIVLTATSVPQITAVVLLGDGRPIDPVLPNGELASHPVTATDYAGLVVSAAVTAHASRS